MYYTLKITDAQGVNAIYEKINHATAINHINQLLVSYGFPKPITKNTFNNIMTRNHVLPDRLKFLLNNNKLSLQRCVC